MYYSQLDLTPEEVIDYLRKSQSDDPSLTVEEVLEKHESRLDEWAIEHLGGVVPPRNKFKEVVSGETIKDRPEFNKILRLIESPKYRAIKVVEPQRLTRGDLEDVGRLMKILKHTDTLVITPEWVYDLRDKYDWERLEMELKRGNDYLEYTKTILSRGKMISVNAGNYISSIPPYGYDKITVVDGKRKCPTLKENKEEADVVRLIFNLYVNEGLGRAAIANHLDKLGVKPPRGKHWVGSTIKGILENVHYTGKIKWNWRKNVTVVKDGEFLKTRPVSKIGEYMIIDGRHEGIISDELFQAALERRGKNPRVKREVEVRNPFAGIIRCNCGKMMVYRFNNDKNGNEKWRPRLICPDQAYCNNGSCMYDDMVDRVCNILRECIDDFQIRIENNAEDSVKLHANIIKNLEKRLKELEEKELAQWEAQSHPDESQRMPQHIFKKLNEKLLQEKEEIRQALCDARESAPEPVDYKEKIATFTEALEALRDPDVDAKLKNMLLKECIDRIDYKRERPQRGNVNGKITWSSPPIELDVKLRV